MISGTESSTSGSGSSQDIQRIRNPRNYSGTIDMASPPKPDTCVDKEGGLGRKSKAHTQTLGVMPFSGQFFYLVKGVQDRSTPYCFQFTVHTTYPPRLYPAHTSCLRSAPVHWCFACMSA